MFIVGYRYDIQQITDLYIYIYPAHLYCSYIHFAHTQYRNFRQVFRVDPHLPVLLQRSPVACCPVPWQSKLREAFTRSFLFFSVKKLSSFFLFVEWWLGMTLDFVFFEYRFIQRYSLFLYNICVSGAMMSKKTSIVTFSDHWDDYMHCQTLHCICILWMSDVQWCVCWRPGARHLRNHM